jgi:hypothetical protein
MLKAASVEPTNAIPGHIASAMPAMPCAAPLWALAVRVASIPRASMAWAACGDLWPSLAADSSAADAAPK